MKSLIKFIAVLSTIVGCFGIASSFSVAQAADGCANVNGVIHAKYVKRVTEVTGYGEFPLECKLQMCQPVGKRRQAVKFESHIMAGPVPVTVHILTGYADYRVGGAPAPSNICPGHVKDAFLQ